MALIVNVNAMIRKTVIELDVNVEEVREHFMKCQAGNPITLFGEKYVMAEVNIEASPDITSKIKLMRYNPHD